jgi:L-2-hydroxyglutarate oxidase LhgO
LDRVDIVIIGAGVIGLAIAEAVANNDRDMYILEKEMVHGQGASSRNSEVIHAGIYYEKGTLKAELCVKSNPLIYEICENNGIAYNKIGKLIVANGESEIKQLEEIIVKGKSNGARGLDLIDSEEVHELEPNIKADAAILSPSTGILDAHGLMDYYLREAKRKAGFNPLVLNTEVLGIKQVDDGYHVKMNSGGELFDVETRMVVNSAGLFSDRIAAMIGIDIDKEGYRMYWCKGDYFSLTGKPPAKMLIYPPPPLDETGLGIHSVPDLTGRLRFGPNSYYVYKLDYSVESDGDIFWQDIVKYFPTVKRNDVHPDMSGIRSKIQAPGEPAKDFVIKDEEELGFPGFINLIGIESPGLTCSPGIAGMVSKMINEYLS